MSKAGRAKKTVLLQLEKAQQSTVMINVWLKRSCSLELTIHDFIISKYPALHRFMGRSPHELRSFSGGREGEILSFPLCFCLVALVKKRRVFMLP